MKYREIMAIATTSQHAHLISGRVKERGLDSLSNSRRPVEKTFDLLLLDLLR